jgi:methyltransferase (TIGR00027 family)
METGKVTGVSRTAIGVAALRALESRRDDRLFDDPYAGAFVAGAREVLEAERTRSPEERAQAAAMFGLHVAIRTRFYDDYLLSAAAAGCHQVVLLAAGLDARAFRLHWPAGVRLFELDLPEVLDYKERVLTARHAVPHCQRTVLRVDLREDWSARLLEAGLDPAQPSAWLVEGLLVYLSAEEAAALLTALGDLSAPGSRLSCESRDGAQDSLFAKALDTPAVSGTVAMWKGGLGKELAGWLTGHGWRLETHRGVALAERYGRPDPAAASIGFLTAVRDGES